MMSSIKQRLDREDDGFTLIELMVVVLIIAILLAIAIPTFLGARNSANARSAQSNLRNALTAEQTNWTNNQTFGDATAMTTVESSLSWTTAAPTAGNVVTVVPGDTDSSGNFQAVALEAFGKDGKCYYLLQSNDPNNSFTGYAVAPQVSNACTAPAAPSVTATTPTVTSGSASAHPSTAGTLAYYTSW